MSNITREQIFLPSHAAVLSPDPASSWLVMEEASRGVALGPTCSLRCAIQFACDIDLEFGRVSAAQRSRTPQAHERFYCPSPYLASTPPSPSSLLLQIHSYWSKDRRDLAPGICRWLAEHGGPLADVPCTLAPGFWASAAPRSAILDLIKQRVVAPESHARPVGWYTKLLYRCVDLGLGAA